jgi:CIC family chloride channel protein
MNDLHTMSSKPVRLHRRVLEHPLLRRYFPLVSEDLRATYARDLSKWLVIAPLIGLITGLVVTGVAVVILKELWPPLLALMVRRLWTIVPIVTAAFAVTGLIMQHFTPDPNEHSTEEIIRSYHEHQGQVNVRYFVPKILAAITTVGFGGSAALEGPSIYAGGAIGSWLWTKLHRWRLKPRDRRIMLISGAAAGMAAVFRAPMTGLVFALEMPYKDDLAHEALLPSLLASVVSYMTLAAFLGAEPLFNFASGITFNREDLLWSAFLGALMGLAAMAFTITFRRARVFMVHWQAPHWVKLTLGGFLTGLCGLGFLLLYRGPLVPLGPNYEAVGQILQMHHSSGELIVFGIFKLAATLFTLATGGVSAMFVPLFLAGGSFGTAFAQVIHSHSIELFAAVGMAAFISAGYKTPLAAVVFVAEATGGHAFIVPALIGSAVAYAVSGEASASGDQRQHEGLRVQELHDVPVGSLMQQTVVAVPAETTLRAFAESIGRETPHLSYPVVNGNPARVTGLLSVASLGAVPVDAWETKTVGEIADGTVPQIGADCDALEAIRLLSEDREQRMLLVTAPDGSLVGIVTSTDLLHMLRLSGSHTAAPSPAK